VPPLRERLDDIPDLVRHFVDQNTAQGLPHKSFTAEAFDELKKHRWPGNVRELENNVRRICALYSENEIDADVVAKELAGSLTGQNETAHASLRQAVDQHLRAFFSAHTHGLPSAGLYNRILREVEKPLIEQTLDATRGNQIRAAEVLGLNRNTLRKKIRDLDIEVIRGLRRPDD
jgi:two-component system nitrogen regulation response regulator GlnG